MNAVAYARFSSDKQRDASIEEQLADIKKYANQNGYIVTHEYCDYAVSGASENREQFQNMIRDSKNGQFDTVLIFDYTRFSRQGDDGFFDELLLARNGINLISINEPIGKDLGGKITKYIKYLSAEEDLIKIKRNTMRALKANAMECRANGGTPAFGYDVDPKTKKYIINKKEAVGVKKIFSMLANGFTYNEIIRELNFLNLKTKRNHNDFKKTSIHEIIKNKKYYGMYEWGKITKTKSINQKFKSHRKQNEEHIMIRGGLPAIIDENLWIKANAKLKKRQPRQHSQNDYALHGKVFCGICGGHFVGTTRFSREKNDGYYICSNRVNKHNCKNRAIKQTVLENTVKNEIVNTYLTSAGKVWLTNQFIKFKKENNNVEGELELLNADILDTKSKIEKVNDAYLNGAFSLEEFKTLKTNLQISIDSATEKLKQLNSNIKEDDFKNVIQKIESVFKNDSSLYVELVDSIKIKGDDIVITFRLPLELTSDLHNAGGETGI